MGISDREGPGEIVSDTAVGMYLGIAPPVSGAYGEGRGRPTDSQSRSGWMVRVLGNGAIGGATTAGAPAAQEVTRPVTPPSPAPVSVSCLCLMRFEDVAWYKSRVPGVHLMSTQGTSLANAALWALAPTVVPNETQIHLSSHPWGDGSVALCLHFDPESTARGARGCSNSGGLSRRELRPPKSSVLASVSELVGFWVRTGACDATAPLLACPFRRCRVPCLRCAANCAGVTKRVSQSLCLVMWLGRLSIVLYPYQGHA